MRARAQTTRLRPQPATTPWLTAPLDQLDPVAVRILHETEPRASFADAVRLALRPDSRILQSREGRIEVVDADRDVAVTGAEVVRTAIVVEGELELLLLAGDAEEVVRRLELAVAHDRKLTAELESERLVKGPTLLWIGDPVHGVQVARHGRDPDVILTAASSYQPRWRKRETHHVAAASSG